MNNIYRKFETVRETITSHYCCWFYCLLFGVVSAYVICSTCEFYLFETKPEFDSSEMIDKLISLYGALFSIIVLGSFVYNSFYKTLYVLQKHIPEYNEMVKEKSSLDNQYTSKQKEVYNIVKNTNLTSIGVDSKNKAIAMEEAMKLSEEQAEIQNQIGDKINEQINFTNHYMIPCANWSVLVKKFQHILFSVVFLCVLLLVCDAYSNALLCHNDICNSIIDGVVCFAVFAPILIVANLFSLMKTGISLDEGKD